MAVRDWFGPSRSEPQNVVSVARVYNKKKVEDHAQTSQGWQHEAWRIWERLGEIHYPTTQIARLVSRLDWNCDPEFDLEDFFAEPGLAEVSRTVALNLIVAGEGWLTAGPSKEPDVEREWKVLSVVEPSLGTRLKEQQVKVRVWTPDPRDPSHSDSGVRAAITPGNELIALSNLSLAQTHSRVASMGILLRPNTRKPFVDETGAPVDFTEMLHETFTAAINDTSSPAAVVPIDIEVPSDEIQFWKHLTFDRPYDERVDMRMERTIRRIALALDIWPELLLGVADINHWGSWFLSEDTWRSSTAPLANQVAQAYEVAVEEVTGKKIKIEPDPAVLLARRSSVRDALNAAWIGGISLKYLREVIGAEETDAPPEEDLEIIRLMAGQRRSESRAGITTEDDAPTTPQSGDQDSIQAVMGALGDVTDNLGVELVRVDDQLSAWLEGAAETVVENVRAQVGVRLRRALRSDPRSVDLDGVPNSQAASVIGEAVFDIIDVDPIVGGGVQTLVDRWEQVLERASFRIVQLTGVSVSDLEWSDARRRSAEILDQTLSDHITSTLTDKSPGLVEFRSVVSAAGLD